MPTQLSVGHFSLNTIKTEIKFQRKRSLGLEDLLPGKTLFQKFWIISLSVLGKQNTDSTYLNDMSTSLSPPDTSTHTNYTQTATSSSMKNDTRKSILLTSKVFCSWWVGILTWQVTNLDLKKMQTMLVVLRLSPFSPIQIIQIEASPRRLSLVPFCEINITAFMTVISYKEHDHGGTQHNRPVLMLTC